MFSTIVISEFLELSKSTVVLDVRSEGEYEQGHVPASINIPLLNNDERKEIGICYKKSGKEKAVLLGFQLVGNKFANFIQAAQDQATTKKVVLYCWRGGMRSNIMAWLLSTAGFKVFLLKGGYKAYRRYVLAELARERNYVILGGKTGSGKTEVLSSLSKLGQAVVDLEKLAAHKGSAFGALGMPEQPSNEQFQNMLFHSLNCFANDATIWLENESRMIGKMKIPDALYVQMRNANVMELDVQLVIRATRIMEEYGIFPKEQLIEITKSLEKRMGNLRMREAVSDLENNNTYGWVLHLLNYYDQAYAYGMSTRDAARTIYVQTPANYDADAIAVLLVQTLKSNTK